MHILLMGLYSFFFGVKIYFVVRQERSVKNTLLTKIYERVKVFRCDPVLENYIVMNASRETETVSKTMSHGEFDPGS
ncbi:hypothetical protein, partial [Sulfobacillus sp. hq2]|uniref:hypothetical protein n=1 Tax=Sulfobacillus sp. hq2 TaxID=2039167 RepID=UPI000D4E696F